MIEVFKTNVKKRHHARMLVARIHETFSGYTANFDLHDCDNILRIKCTNGHVQTACLIELLKQAGFHAEVLPEQITAS